MDEDSNLEEPEKDAVITYDENTNQGEDSNTGFEEGKKMTRLADCNNEVDEDDDEDGNTKESFEEESEDSEDSEEESDSLDEEEAELRKTRYVSDMDDLENQFSDLKEQLYKEQITQIERQLEEVSKSEAKEYTGPLKQIEQECVVRTEVAGHMKNYRTINLENKLQCELQTVEQHFKNEEKTLIENLTADFEEKIRKVEEEKHSSEMYSALWCDDTFRSKKKRKSFEIHLPEKRKKPVTVSGPYIIYMLNEMDILEDWAAIRKAKCELARRRAAELSARENDPLINAKYEDGKLFYQNEWFQKGDHVVLDNGIDSPVHVTIANVNTGEVWVTKADGVKCKLYISQFQKGKYLISRSTPVSIADEIL